jgi:TFIIF-interacting CTD phosphatase-like protein
VEAASHFYEVFIFTAATQDYADPLINIIDPNGKITGRLYRQHCVEIPPFVERGVRFKDVLSLGQPPGQVVLVDNSPFCLRMQPENAVPVVPFLGADADYELVGLFLYLRELAGEADVRARNLRQFKTLLWGTQALTALFADSDS